MNKKEQSKLRIKTEYVGVYTRELKKRIDSEGEPDLCYDIVWCRDKKTKYKSVGCKSEGMTAQEAAKIRLDIVQEDRPRHEWTTKAGKRIKTRHTGVYTREGRRTGADGKPDICYEIVWRDKDGKTRYKKVGWKSEGFTVKDAVIFRAATILEKHTITYQNPEPLQEYTLQYIWEQYEILWLPNLKNQKKLIGNYNLYIKEAFGNHYTSQITSLDIEKFKQTLLNDTLSTKGKKLSPGTVHAILSVFRRILRKGVEWELIRTPLPIIHLPKVDDKRERYLTSEEARKLLNCLEYVSCQNYFIAKISLYTGMRLGEIINIKVCDIDINAQIIHVMNGKTGSRTAYISDDLLPDIKCLISKSENFIFNGKDGKMIHSSKISRDFSNIVHDLGFNDNIEDTKYKCVFHTLRHTFCSWLAIKGVPLFTIGKLVGHSNAVMTERYAKLSPDSKRSALIHIDDTLKKI